MPEHYKKQTILKLLFCFVSFFAAGLLKAQPVKNKSLNYNAFCFYYNWHGNPQHDGQYVHWAHSVMKANPADTTSGVIPGGDNIASNFYPSLGAYSNNDPKVIKKHMQMIEKAGIGNIVVTWWKKDAFTAKSVKLIMDEAAKKGIKVSFHIEPFGGRNAAATREALEYLIDTYGNHPAFYRSENENKPVFFIYDSYLTKPEEWESLLQPGGQISIRNTKYDATVIALWLSDSAKDFVLTSGFDGFYTYFASTGFTAGSTPANWDKMAEWAIDNNKIFIPCVGPGYIDTRVRPWNAKNTKDRDNGTYYDHMFSMAIASKAPFIGITSFNEWHEGTQIEPAIQFKSKAFNYLDYQNRKPDYYLMRTKHWLKEFKKLKKVKNIQVSVPVKVMSYNIHHCNPPSKAGLINLESIGFTLKSSEPDIIALQEVDMNTNRSGDIDQARLIASKLNMKFSFGKAIDHDGGEYGIAILSKYSLKDVKVYPLPSDPLSKGEPRVLMTTKITLPSGQTVLFANTHLDSQKSPRSREMQMKEILSITSKETLPLIIAGDFNASPDSQVIQELDNNLQRTCQQCAPTIPSMQPVKAIDFIAFSKKRFIVLKNEVVQDPYSSDHLPVLSTLQLRADD